MYLKQTNKQKPPISQIRKYSISTTCRKFYKRTRINMAKITIKNLILGMKGKKPIYSIGH